MVDKKKTTKSGTDSQDKVNPLDALTIEETLMLIDCYSKRGQDLGLRNKCNDYLNRNTKYDPT